MFESIKKISAATRLMEEGLYEQVVNELMNGQKRSGLWAKAVANSNGHEEKAKSLYIQYRVQSLKDEDELLRNQTLNNDKENHIRDDADEESTLWIHILVWSIIGVALLSSFLTQW